MLKKMLEKAKTMFVDSLEQQKALLKSAEDEKRDLTEDEISQIDNLQKSMDTAELDIERYKKLIAAEEKVNAPDDEPGTPKIPVVFDTQGKKLDDGGFKNVGEFMYSIRFGDKKGRLEPWKSGVERKADEPMMMPDFGFMMPPELYRQIMELPMPENIVRRRAMVLPAGEVPDNSIIIPLLDQTSDTGNMFGGVEVEWIEEGEFKPETSVALKNVEITPHELAASSRVTDKALRNFTALSPLLTRTLGAAILNAEDLAFIKGHGDKDLQQGQSKQPLGILKSGALKKINRATAGTVTFPDIINIEKSVLPNSRARSEWLIDLTLYDAIQLLKDEAGHYIFGSGDASMGRPDRLRGLPIIWTDKTASGGVAPTLADIGLYDFGYYVIKNGFGPVIQASPHPYFQNNVTVIKIFTNVGGKPWLSAPLKLENGLEVSPFVALDVPRP